LQIAEPLRLIGCREFGECLRVDLAQIHCQHPGRTKQ
jgi:hypothetical protein